MCPGRFVIRVPTGDERVAAVLSQIEAYAPQVKFCLRHFPPTDILEIFIPDLDAALKISMLGADELPEPYRRLDRD